MNIRRTLPGLFLAAALPATAQQSPDARMNTFVTNLMKRITIEEKIAQLNLGTPGGAVTGSVVSGDVESKIRSGAVVCLVGIYGPGKTRQAQRLAVENNRPKIPLIFGSDVIHGHRTIFPILLAIFCSWKYAHKFGLKMDDIYSISVFRSPEWLASVRSMIHRFLA